MDLSHPSLMTLSSSKSRLFLFGAALGLVALALGVTRLFERSDALPPSPEATLRVAVLGGPEQAVLAFLGEQNPRLHLETVLFSSPEEARDALRTGEVSAGSFETLEALHRLEPSEFVDIRATLALPYGFYSKTIKSLDALTEGIRIVVPQDATESRALHLLYSSGLIVYASELDTRARLTDVEKNPRRVQLVAVPREALETELLSAGLVGLDFETAQKLGLNPARHALLVEDAFTPFHHVLSVRRDTHQSSPAWLSELTEAYGSAEIKRFILTRFNDAVRRPW